VRLRYERRRPDHGDGFAGDLDRSGRNAGSLRLPDSDAVNDLDDNAGNDDHLDDDLDDRCPDDDVNLVHGDDDIDHDDNVHYIDIDDDHHGPLDPT